MTTPWKSQQLGYEDVPLAIHEIVRSEKEFRFAGWVVAAALILINLLGLSATVLIAQWLMPTVNPVVVSIVTTGAYVVGVLGVEIERLCRKISRMEMRALRLHDELLCVNEKIEDVDRMHERKRSPAFD